MHMADALFISCCRRYDVRSLCCCGGRFARAAAQGGACRTGDGKKKLPTMAVMSALVFAGQMINYTIPGTGSSGHLCGGMLLSAMLGPWAGFFVHDRHSCHSGAVLC